ncbi:ComEC/Rec2 family competence protein [Algoriphagus zhangzhouensis]|uniref:Competence protein ComEC n=1 Tax=Algoriphagus zhangzhouensis TaxID=1073327 RepID=A0A1M7ZIM0_9BACT|nr:ComEC/Rec2 family competence protein [Algoriphagus zhangzhouensis]TDY43729.1 competence protein ComEC [Algoriphagus zhangzhouensis]SHO64755.1 competence protein ComEC [Algoriphagus zhangzhouensis]
MRFSDFPFLRYLFFFLMGIWIEKVIYIPQYAALFLLGSIWLIYLFWVLRKKTLGFAAFLAYLQLLLFGVFCGGLHFNGNEEIIPISNSFIAKVSQDDVPKPNSKQNILDVFFELKNSQWVPRKEKVIVYHQVKEGLKSGQIVCVDHLPTEVESPQNPYEFDYKSYLQKSGINFTQFLNEEGIVLLKAGQGSNGTWFQRFRISLINQIRRHVPDPEVQDVAIALLLGQKDFLGRDTKAVFRDTGVMHILAVSGLHVGILVTLLFFLAKPFSLKGKGLRIYLLGVVCCIWGYAALTGFSPSVVRASVMFSLITFGQMRERKPSVFNILAFSAMLMIVIDPSVICEVGFQLSYLAVSGIVLLYPLILRWWLPPNKGLDYFWQIVSVSISAQLTTFPLTVFYFHSFPPWFLLANIFVIPLTFVIMQVGIPFLILGWIPGVDFVLGWLVNGLIKIELWLLSIVQNLPFGKAEDLSIEPETMILVWGILLIWAAWEYFPKKNLVYLGAFILSGWFMLGVYRSIKGEKPQAIIYKSQNGYAVDFWDGTRLKSWNQGIRPGDIDYKINPNRINNSWGTQPDTLIALAKEFNQLIFPEIGWILNQDSVLQVSTGGRVQIFENGKWEDAGPKDLTDSNSALKILF